MSEPTEVVWHPATIERRRGCVVWLTGLSGSGKSTVANCVDAGLHAAGRPSFVLDGDNVRHGLNASPERLEPEHGREYAERVGLGFAPQDREENIRRVGCVAEIFSSAGLIVLSALVSPYRRDRERVRQTVCQAGGVEDFLEVFVDTPLEVCESRDPKGLYRKARAGELRGMTGIDAPYETPTAPELHLDGTAPVEVLAEQVLECLRQRNKID